MIKDLLWTPTKSHDRKSGFTLEAPSIFGTYFIGHSPFDGKIGWALGAGWVGGFVDEDSAKVAANLDYRQRQRSQQELDEALRAPRPPVNLPDSFREFTEFHINPASRLSILINLDQVLWAQKTISQELKEDAAGIQTPSGHTYYPPSCYQRGPNILHLHFPDCTITVLDQ